MKVLFAYDGSSGADAALHDLQHAGLPSVLECMVLSVADVWLAPVQDSGDETISGNLDPAVRARILAMRETARAKVAEAAAMAKHWAQIIQSLFPTWRLSSEALADSPAWGILNRADSWAADLIVTGSHGMSATARILIGSVSRKVLSHASCSVRIARGSAAKHHAAPRLIIGFDGSSDAEAAVREVASRDWPDGTQVRLITVVDDTIRTAIAARILKLDAWLEGGQTDDHHIWLSKMTEGAAERLRRVRLDATCLLSEGEPKRVLLDEAQQWQADSIFVGATGLRGLQRLLLGSVSSSVATAASCTVEVVRRAS
jgi:nucleotide-binding universal stress UspA family protein